MLLAIVLFVAYILPRVTGGGGSEPTRNTAATTSGAASATSGTPRPTQGATGVVPPAPQGGGGSPQQPQQTPTETRQSVSENKTPAKADTEALRIALLWAEGFVNHPDNVKPEDWLNQLKPYTTDEYFGATVSKIDPKAVAQSKIRSGPVATADSYTSSVTVDIATDVRKLRLTLVKTDAGWRVNEHTEVD